MQSNQIPAKFPIPFANGAGAGYVRTVPTASQIGITPGAASLTDGFPPVCFQPVGAGGIPPSGQDFNGLLSLVTAWTRWTSAGAPIYYDPTFATAISGYPKGAVVQSTGTVGSFWLCTVENNTTNPDTGGAGWTGFSVLIGSQTSAIYNNLITNYPSILPPRNILTSISVHGSGSITVPANVTEVFFRLLGAGGGGGCGGGSFSNYSGGGGGSGGYSEGWIAVTPGQVIPYTVGQGGTGATTNAVAAGTGGTSTFGPATCTGGLGGILSTTLTSAGGSAGVGSGGQVNFSGAIGGDGNPYVTEIQGGYGGASAFGGGGRTATIGLPGSTASNAIAPGSGGGGIWGGNSGNSQGGSGADGALVVYY